MNAQIARDLDSSLWNEINPKDCPCKGYGWLLSPFDTFHTCQTHYRGQICSEDMDTCGMTDAESDEFFAEVNLIADVARWENYRAAWLMWESASGRTPEAWVAEVQAALPAKGTQRCFCGHRGAFEYEWSEVGGFRKDKCSRCGARPKITINLVDGLLGTAASIVTCEAAIQADEDAKAAGYSCALEQRWAQDARDERGF